MSVHRLLVLIRGGGDLATGVAHRLCRVGMWVVVTELPQPRAIRRAVAFASAIYEGEITVEGVRARRANDLAEIQNLLAENIVPVVVDPDGALIPALQLDVLVDARMAKRNLGTTIGDAAVVIGLGPGFEAGRDVHAVIETAGGHHLGRVITIGTAEPNTGVPRPVMGYERERVLWAPAEGVFHAVRRIGDRVFKSDVVGEVAGQPVVAGVSGVIRGLLHEGLEVQRGEKVGDVDPRGKVEYCYSISDKARAIGGGVLEAIGVVLFSRGSGLGRLNG